MIEEQTATKQANANSRRWALRQRSKIKLALSAPVDEYKPHPTLLYAFIFTTSDLSGGELSRLSRNWRIVTIMGTNNDDGLPVVRVCCQSKRA